HRRGDRARGAWERRARARPRQRADVHGFDRAPRPQGGRPDRSRHAGEVVSRPLPGLVALVVALALPPAARAQTPPTARLDSLVGTFVPQRFMGVVLVTRRDSVLLDRAYGLADRSAQLPNLTTMRYPIGSLTKQFTAAAVMLLVERGALRTADTVTR